MKKFKSESEFVNGIEMVEDGEDTIYLVDNPVNHYEIAKKYLKDGISVICESPITLDGADTQNLFDIARENNCFLFDGIKTAYSTAFARLILLVKSGKIGDVVSVDSTCTSMRDFITSDRIDGKWNSICGWGPTALLPIFLILGTNYKTMDITTKLVNVEQNFDGFTKIDFVYENAVATVKVAKKAKSEGELIISGTKGYLIVPAPWWKTDYFELRFEESSIDATPC